MKNSLIAVLAVLLPTLGAVDAFGQNEPIPGYFELQVAFCWGLWSAMAPANSQATNWACGPNMKSTPTFNCQIATKENAESIDQTNALRDYLFTGTVDHGANEGALIAMARGKKLAADMLAGSSDVTPQEVKDKSAECLSVIKELPY
jgi:hypothetical protein